jgi:asparagine synthase (glutamine-hydrolysing)
VKTFSIGFYEQHYNEAEYAQAVARHLGTDHTELYVTPEQAMAVIPKLPTLYDEPFSDSSQIPTFLISELARQYVTVSLSGDGGDELFCGYTRYDTGQYRFGLRGKIEGISPWGRRFLANVLSGVRTKVVDGKFGSLVSLLRKHGLVGVVGSKLNMMAETLVDRPHNIYLELVSHWKNPAFLVLGAKEPPTPVTNLKEWADLTDFVQQMMYLDMVTYLPDDILAKVDHASFKIKHGQSKWLLRQVLYRYIPSALIDRPKMGFSVPIDTWLRRPLRAWAEDLLDEARLQREGFFHPKLIRQKWTEYLGGKQDWLGLLLWDVLMFQAWLEHEK